MCDDNGDTCIENFHNILLAPDICGRLFSIIMLINLGHTCLFHKGFYKVHFGDKEKYVFTLPHIAQRENEFWG